MGLPFIAQPQSSESFRRMVIVAVDGLPVDEFAVRIGALNAVKVDAHFQAVFGFAAVNLGHWDAHFAEPDFLVSIYSRFDLVTGVPAYVVFRRIRLAVNVQIHPLALRRNLKLGVMLDVLKSVPMKASATSHSHNLLVSVVVEGFGFRFSSS